MGSFARRSQLRQILAAVKAARGRLAALGLDCGSGLRQKSPAGEGTNKVHLLLKSKAKAGLKPLQGYESLEDYKKELTQS